ncbi:MAG: GNAT family N-acetyltransferase [Gammaproteobacteria bacterium]|nr:GNAT family N-acetyltransferase [Gammaproteobacteria bacterium]
MTRRVTIEEAREADIPRVVDLLFHLDAHVSGAPRDVLKMTDEGERQLAAHLRTFLDNPYKLLLVARHPRAGVVGTADIALWKQAEVWETPERQGQWYGIIDDVWVEPDHRRQGLNRRMLRQLVVFARSHDVESLELEYSASNQEAARAWKRMGFRPVGVRAAASARDVLAGLDADEQGS